MFLSLKAVSQKHCDLSRCISANSSQALSCVSLKYGVFWSPVSPQCPILFRKQKSYHDPLLFLNFCHFGSASGFWPYTKEGYHEPCRIGNRDLRLFQSDLVVISLTISTNYFFLSSSFLFLFHTKQYNERATLSNVDMLTDRTGGDLGSVN